VARIEPSVGIADGDRPTLSLDARHVHLFDAASHRNLML
jgi:hypothetical protein